MRTTRAPGRPAFTMIELLVAASVTALVATAGATFISAISNASLTTRSVTDTKTTGHFAIFQMTKTIREARGIGQVTPSTVTLWLSDSSADDKMNLYETGVIRYDASNQQLVFDYLQPSGGTTPATQLATSSFTDASALLAVMPSADKKTVVWAQNIESLTFTGQPDGLQTRMVEVRFTVNTNGQSVAFLSAAGPKAPADYLFYPETQSSPPAGSTRKSRKLISAWDGFKSVQTLSTAVEAL